MAAALCLHAVAEAPGGRHGSQTWVSDGPDPRARGLPEAFQQMQRRDGGSAHRKTLISFSSEKNHLGQFVFDYFCNFRVF